MPQHRLSETRPVFLQLRAIRLPLNALVSIGHRLSGLLLFLLLPFLLLLWHMSLTPTGFARLLHSGGIVRGTIIVLLAVFAWHAVAGVRVMWLDWRGSADLRLLRQTAWLVPAAMLLTVMLGLLWL